MDRSTLLTHRHLWVEETARFDGELPHLTVEERSLFDDLKADRLGDRVRLEQERIPFGLVLRASAKTSCGTSSGGLIGLR